MNKSKIGTILLIIAMCVAFYFIGKGDKEIVDNLKEQLENCDEIVQLKDTIIYKERIVIEYKDKIIETKPKPKPFGIGVNAGYGINGEPYIGVGVSYNLIRF